MFQSCQSLFFFFFFQAEDGIRDGRVTGVQTCALPIYSKGSTHKTEKSGDTQSPKRPILCQKREGWGTRREGWSTARCSRLKTRRSAGQIGRASCRERV